MPGVFFGVHRRLPREESRDKSAILSSQEQMVVSMLSATWFVQSPTTAVLELITASDNLTFAPASPTPISRRSSRRSTRTASTAASEEARIASSSRNQRRHDKPTLQNKGRRHFPLQETCRYLAGARLLGLRCPPVN
ncbi:hypothetical protein FOMPIDRAFT_1026432 [Fomitopsis schrenkii]|uniref:Uncharacterized protein n=1 Tax=Fomitopsis schrenkii TaxID=2126942 RepID=S8EVW7_FOMSC|nr:hypothetical protein FOMPIDRAFT_1026432 [Fomitopsis schrenkii]